MMKLISSPGHPLTGCVELPGDKSVSHRAALFAALALGESSFKNFLIAGVTNNMLQALSDLGIEWELDQDNLKVKGQGIASWHTPVKPLDCGNSATTMRLLAGALAATGTAARLDGSSGLRQRPMQRVVTPLQKMAVPISASEGGKAPLVLSYRPLEDHLKAIDFSMPVASAQVKTAIMLAALVADGQTIIREPGPSRDHSERMLASMGARISSIREDPIISTTISPLAGQALQPLHMSIPGDFSSAAFLLVAALITPGSEIKLCNVGLNPTRTGLLDALIAMGAQVQISNLVEEQGEPVGDLVVKYGPLKAIEVNGPMVVRMIDEFPVFAIATTSAEGVTIVRQAAELRNKESDRIAVLCRNLKKIGVQVEELPDGFVIQGGSHSSGGTINAHGDHRMAMAFAVAGLTADSPIYINGAEMIAESFPGFVDSLGSLGADISMDV